MPTKLLQSSAWKVTATKPKPTPLFQNASPPLTNPSLGDCPVSLGHKAEQSSQQI